MTLSLFSLNSCGSKSAETEATTTEPAPWIVDKFDDIKVLRYEVPGFEKLPLQQKTLIYYLAQATKAGRDILFDQNFKYNLTIRRTLEHARLVYDALRASIPEKVNAEYQPILARQLMPAWVRYTRRQCCLSKAALEFRSLLLASATPQNLSLRDTLFLRFTNPVVRALLVLLCCMRDRLRAAIR